jgi:protein TonB
MERIGSERPHMRLALMATQPGRDSRLAAVSTGLSIALHALVVAGLVWATLHASRAADTNDEKVTLFTLAPEPPNPVPPPPPPVAPPPAPANEPAPEVARGFQTLVAPTVTPPDIPTTTLLPATNEADFSGEGVQGGRASGTATTRVVTSDDVAAAPTFTPYTVSPELRNRREVGQALVKLYPKLLRESGIGGTVLVWFFIDETGKVRKAQLKEKSGYPALDEAALRVADIMEFTPALNRDRKVAVWVSLPIEFSSK